MMLKQCGCGKIVKATEKNCKECAAKKGTPEERKEYHRHYDRARRNERSRKFYASKEWKQVRQTVMERDNYMCVVCLKRDGVPVDAHVVDHVTPLLVDWSRCLDVDNLQSLCMPCHSRKTGREQSQVRRS